MGSGEELLKVFVVVDVRRLKIFHVDIIRVHEPFDLFLRGRCTLVPSAGDRLVIDVETHTIRGIDPFRKLVEEEDELNLLP